jgi:hypothetical protein
MNAREIKAALTAADPLRREQHAELERLDFEAMEADLLADAAEEPTAAPPTSRPTRRHLPRLALAGGVLAIAATIAVAIVFAGGGTERASRAYGAELVRFAESTPLLLLDGPGWRVQEVNERKTREGTEGQMEFVTGKPVPGARLWVSGNDEEGQHVKGLQPAATRQRLVRLEWRELSQESLATAIHWGRRRIHPHGRHFVRLPVAGTTAFVDTRAEIFVNQGGPGDREMVALWGEDGYLLVMQAAVPSLAAMRERLDWVTKVDSQTWLEAMPDHVVKAADLEGTTRAMLRGVPLPKTFALSRIPNEGLTTSRNQVAGKVAATVACLWFRQWGEAVRTGDAAARVEAERAMATSRRWPFLDPATGGAPGIASSIWRLAEEMPQGYWDFRGHHRDLLAHAEGMGCARLGLPLLPEKMQRQRERGVPPPPD